MTEPNTARLFRSDEDLCDSLLTKATPWDYLFNAMSPIQKIRLTSSFLVVTRPYSPASITAP
jgi:hypothetical protein